MAFFDSPYAHPKPTKTDDEWHSLKVDVKAVGKLPFIMLETSSWQTKKPVLPWQNEGEDDEVVADEPKDDAEASAGDGAAAAAAAAADDDDE